MIRILFELNRKGREPYQVWGEIQ